jgi:hypothetical protein
MMAFALGQLGWSERQFYCSTYRAYINAYEGYHNEKKIQQIYMRRQAMIVYWALGGKASAESAWPIEKEKDAGLEDRLQEKLRRHREEHAVAQE